MPAPKKSQSTQTNEGRAVVTLPPAVAAAVRRMDGQMGGDLGPAEVVRRGLILLDFYLSLTDDEDLMVRDRRSSDLDRVRIAWDTF